MSDLLTFILACAMYFAPTIVALYRGHASKWGIIILNLCLGWTVVFWFAALVWALSNKGASNVITINNVNNGGRND